VAKRLTYVRSRSALNKACMSTLSENYESNSKSVSIVRKRLPSELSSVAGAGIGPAPRGL